MGSCDSTGIIRSLLTTAKPKADIGSNKVTMTRLFDVDLFMCLLMNDLRDDSEAAALKLDDMAAEQRTLNKKNIRYGCYQSILPDAGTKPTGIKKGLPK